MVRAHRHCHLSPWSSLGVVATAETVAVSDHFWEAVIHLTHLASWALGAWCLYVVWQLIRTR